jgi:hypothetical protein
VVQERVNRECEGGQISSLYFVYVFEKRTMKSVETVVER